MTFAEAPRTRLPRAQASASENGWGAFSDASRPSLAFGQDASRRVHDPRRLGRVLPEVEADLGVG